MVIIFIIIYVIGIDMELPLSLYLKENCRTTHDSVDHLVMSVKPFDTIENYTRFLQLQAVFHQIVDGIYKDQLLNQGIEDLAELARYEEVLKDLKDLQANTKDITQTLPIPQGKEVLGWLYCAEGSNIGAAFLYKAAQHKLGLTAEYGARHLAPHAEGRAKHWKDFCDQFNQIDITVEDRAAALKGALDAFATYKALLREVFELSPATV